MSDLLNREFQVVGMDSEADEYRIEQELMRCPEVSNVEADCRTGMLKVQLRVPLPDFRIQFLVSRAGLYSC